MSTDDLKPRLHLPGRVVHLVKSEEGVFVQPFFSRIGQS